MYLPTWASDLATRRSRLDRTHAVLLSHLDHQREAVGSCCAVALRAGVHPGMTLTHARALLPPNRTHVEPLDVEGNARSLRRFGAWMIRFVPTLAVDPPDGLWLDATGCERLYGGLDRLINRMQRAVKRLGIATGLAAAPTWGAAWAIARFGSGPAVNLDPNVLQSTLAPLPIAALRIDETTQAKLHRVGIERIRHLLDLPRTSLADRYGDELLMRLDQALGQAVESIVPIRPRAPIVAERLFDGPTDQTETIQLVARELLVQVAALLAARQCGCRVLELTLLRSDLDPLILTVQTARPTCDGRHLWTLARPKVESAHLGFGVEGVRAQARAMARLSHEQHTAWEEDRQATPTDVLGRLVDTLVARLGTDRVLRIAPVESHQPERSFEFERVASIDHKPRAGTIPAPSLIDADRPSLLLPRPIRIDATFLVPDGPIARLDIRRDSQRIIASIGPERIEGEWWRGASRARDYFKVQTESGRCLWVYREVGTGRDQVREQWFMHGEWA